MTDATGTPIKDYKSLRVALAERRKHLGLSQLELDDIAGVQSGYCGKIEAGIRHLGSMSLGCILGALKLELFVRPVADLEKAK